MRLPTRSRMAAALLAACLLSAAPGAMAAENGAENPELSLPSFGSKESNEALRRFEIVSLGAFPIMLFYSDFTFDLVRFIASGFTVEYAPWPFKSSSSFSPGDGERLARIGVALGASIGVGIADAWIRIRAEQKAEARARALEAAGETSAETGSSPGAAEGPASPAGSRTGP